MEAEQEVLDLTGLKPAKPKKLRLWKWGIVAIVLLTVGLAAGMARNQQVNDNPNGNTGSDPSVTPTNPNPIPTVPSGFTFVHGQAVSHAWNATVITFDSGSHGATSSQIRNGQYALNLRTGQAYVVQIWQVITSYGGETSCTAFPSFVAQGSDEVQDFRC